MSPHIASMSARINALTPRLRRIAAHNTGTCSEYDADDLYQTIVLKLLERTAVEPEFARRSDKELLIHADWRSRSKAEAGRTYTRYVRNEEIFQAGDLDGLSELDLIPASSSTPEEAHIERETLEVLERAVQKMDPRNQQIVYLLYQGYSQNEIAAALQVTKGAVSQRKAQIAQALADLVN